MRLRLLLVCALAACGAEKFPQPGPVPTTSSTASAPPPATASSAPDAPWSPPDTGGQAPTEEVLKDACGPIVKVFEDSGLRGRDEKRALLDAMVKNPPPLPAGQFDWCKTQIKALLDDADKRSVVSEATNHIGAIAKDMVGAYHRESIGPGHAVVRTLCPSAKAVPKALSAAGASYQSKPEEWRGDAGWSCLRFSIDAPQLYQYEVRATAKSFVVYARRVDGAQIEELSLSGEVDAKSGDVVLAREIVTKRRPAK